MAVLAWVFGFLLIFTVATHFRYEEFYSSKAHFKVWMGKRKVQRLACIEAKKTCASLYKMKREETENVRRASVPKEDLVYPLYLDYPPYNAKLNLAKILRKHTFHDTAHYIDLFARLLNVLYGKCKFFNKYPNTAYLLIEKLIEKSSCNPNQDKLFLQTEHDLASIEFDDDELQKIWYKLLKGAKIGGKHDQEYPSLLDFVIIENNRRKHAIHIHLAPVELLEALFNHRQAALKIVEKRKKLYESYKKQSSKKGHWITYHFLQEEDVENILKEYQLSLADFKPFLDFTTRFRYQEGLAKNFAIENSDYSFVGRQPLPKFTFE